MLISTFGFSVNSYRNRLYLLRYHILRIWLHRCGPTGFKSKPKENTRALQILYLRCSGIQQAKRGSFTIQYQPNHFA